jgi:hypothetical protein
MGLQQPGERLKKLGAAFKDPIHSLGAIGTFLAGRACRTVRSPRFTQVHELLEREASLVERLVHDLALAVEDVLFKHGKAIIERQFLQERMANAAIDIFLATAVLSRTTAALERAGADGARAELDCARVFVPMAYRRARRNIRGLRRNQDTRLSAIAQRAVDSGDPAPLAPGG